LPDQQEEWIKTKSSLDALTNEANTFVLVCVKNQELKIATTMGYGKALIEAKKAETPAAQML